MWENLTTMGRTINWEMGGGVLNCVRVEESGIHCFLLLTVDGTCFKYLPRDFPAAVDYGLKL